MARFFVRTPSGDGDCLAYRLQVEGHEVVLRIDDAWCRPNLDGIVPHTQRDPRPGEVVVFGTSKAGEDAAALERDDILVVGGAPIADTLEMNRWQFIQTCRRLGIDTPETARFTNYERAKEFVADDGGRFVLKPSGDQDAACTYVAHDADDMRLMLDHFARQMPTADFLLQRFQEGVEISVEAWFNGDEWVDGSFNATMETKKFLPGDIGPATGCSTSTVWAYDQEPSWGKLHRRFTEMLRKGRYRGPFDLNLIVTKDTMYALEVTPRFGYEGIQNYVELWNMPFGETLLALASGDIGDFDVDTHLMTASIRLSIPPYPSSSKEHRAPGDVPVLIDEADMQRLWPSGIRYDRELDGYYSAPTDGVIGALVAHGTTLERAVTKLLASARRLHIPNLQYRNDVGDGDGTAWQQLAQWGFDIPPVAKQLLKGAPDPQRMRQAAQGAMGLRSPFGVQPFLPARP